ncbi:FAD-dependent monooxygenase [Alcanivorax sp.]|uniref:FAD-dependent monooxygenase n=1 Tax=Alcanivorax sp. TaxID=1872427 RepID=UPI000C11557B|nr:FAD-dependent monooxygenase [Alcanivorax sp.]PHR68543.1 MAG: oxidoreductase [Alcanivorax sp.]
MLIVGAGPTGLALGIGLRRHGIHCCIIDRLAAPSPYSRALGLHARSLEIFEALDVLAPIRKASRRLKAVSVYGDKGFLFELDLTALKAPYPWVLSCPQSEVEAVLIDRYRMLGGELIRSAELLDFRQDGSGVQARIRQGAEVQTFNAELLVGADGVGSTVREQLGIGFKGVDYSEHFLLADVPWDAPWSNDRSHGFLREEGLLLALPLPKGWRLIMASRETPETPLSLAPFSERLTSILGDVPDLGEPRWLSQFSVQRRLAQHYRRNRVFLAGDAAHVQSPLGAQGMNTGLADAFNLSWKLAFYLKGFGQGALLDSYEQERRPVAEKMLYGVDMLSRASLVKLPMLRRSRDSLLKLAGSRRNISSRLLRTASQLDVHYRNSPLVTCGPEADVGWRHQGPLPGDRLPDAALKSVRTGHLHQLHGLLRKPVHHLLLQLSESPEHNERLVMYALSDRLGQEYRERVHLTVIAAQATADEDVPREGTTRIWRDHEGEFASAFGDQGRLWLMRPDGHLAYRAPVSNADDLLSYLERVLGKREG